MHPHATIYHRVRIRAWSALCAAGDARSALASVQSGRSALVHETDWGWLGRTGSDQRSLGLAVARVAHHQLPLGRFAVGIGTSKGELSFLGTSEPTASPTPIRLSDALPGQTSTWIADRLGLDVHIPCACAAACSTGLACLLAGADAIEHGTADHALVGACEASLTPLILAGFTNAGVTCGHQRPATRLTSSVAAGATGFAPAEGAAAFALTAAPGPGLHLVAGVRLGDAGHETHFVDPQTLRTALEALWDCAPQPDLIVCHATGTELGDAYESAGLDSGPWRSVPRLCCKPWIGHCLGASGAVELAIGLESGARRLWKLSLGFGGHLVAVAVERSA